MKRTTDITAAQAKESHPCALFLRSRDGDSAGYRRFLATLGARFRGFLRRRLDDRAADVEDLVQEILLAVTTEDIRIASGCR
jgi:RNA polymerase sigma-70 factor, ECF subfamily